MNAEWGPVLPYEYKLFYPRILMGCFEDFGIESIT